jgi:hypothetical protein
LEDCSHTLLVVISQFLVGFDDGLLSLFAMTSGVLQNDRTRTFCGTSDTSDELVAKDIQVASCVGGQPHSSQRGSELVAHAVGSQVREDLKRLDGSPSRDPQLMNVLDIFIAFFSR